MAGESAHQIWAEGLAALDAALRALETKGRRAIAERIRTAREMSSGSHALATGTTSFGGMLKDQSRFAASGISF
jgi:hypothetical protein